eukprot:TRINITY_DN23535_c0_g1_i1.p1 TRINITY_DN23535_c0_g1~~TRINITY_DN23535_c0_g1_i1.p1  ORF type:complete len:109 (+),score=44.25 TRINITY_DN23535_c0_g1_i1:107-433(+)
MAQQGEEDKKVEEYKTLWGCRILWPPDFPDDMLEDAVKIAHEAVEEFGKSDQNAGQIAQKLKTHFDANWEAYWHITVGKNFGCHAVHEKHRFLYFYIDQLAFMLYKAQ